MVEKEEIIDLNLIRKLVEISDIQLFSLYMKEVYKDLVDRAESSKKVGISRVTFYNYSKLPVLIADKLFNAFDKDNDSFLSLKEFIEGMNTLYYGTFKETAKIIFNMYDFDKDGYVNKEDIKILFSYLPLKNEDQQQESLLEIDQIMNVYKTDKFSFNKFLESVEKVKSDIYLQLICFLYEHKPFAVESVESCKFLPKYEIMKQNEDNDSPQSFKGKGSIFTETVNLSSPSKTSIFKPVDSVIRMMEINDFNLDEDDPNEVKISLPTIPKTQQKKFTMKEEYLKDHEMIRMSNQREFENENNLVTPTKYLKRSSDIEIEPFDLSDSSKPQVSRKSSSIKMKGPELIKKGGTIYKVTDSKNIKSYYLLLFNKDLYYYKSEKCKELLGMHNLSGCFVNEVENEKLMHEGRELYAFTVLFSNKTRVYYANSFEEAESWVKILKSAIGYQNFTERYDMQSKTLGEGKFGLVKLGIHKKTQEKVAIKIIKKESMTTKDQELVKSEIDIMKMCKHKNIVRLLDHFENNEFIFIVMEHLAGGTLANYLENTAVDDLTEKDAGIITYQIAKGLEYLHQFGIIHRDLKPENIMIKGKFPYENLESLKIMDFGLSKILGPNERVSDGYGTLTYVAPEVLTRKPYNKHVDIWSLGVIVYYTLCGNFPFDDPSNDEEIIAKKTVFNELKFTHKSWASRTPSVKDFILKTMTKDLEKRAKIGDIINHQWFIDCDIIPGKKQQKKSMVFDS